MAYLALYRKYRPKSFSEMVGQERVVRVIKNAVMNDKVSHAYLFSGPRGTGKTTTAKIIAKMVNCQDLVDGVPCGKCHSCINILESNDVIEIDAASNNGVDEIRELRDKVNLVPTDNKYKIYIIDEVHMLTTQAFNALLKTLEEPPHHVIFILATTEFHKIPMTIISRCQKFQFTKIDDDSMVANLRRIATAENIDVDDSVLYEISRLSDGCCRDAVNLFDQLISYSGGKLNIEQLYELSGSVSYVDLYDIMSLIFKKNAFELMMFCNRINNEGKSIFKFVEELIWFIKDIISYKVGIDEIKIVDKKEKIKELVDVFSDATLYEMIEMLNDLLNKLKVSSYPAILLSVAFLKFIENDYDNESKVILENSSISNDNISIKIENKVVEMQKEDNKVGESTKKSDNNIVDNNILPISQIEIRINNTLAVANKEILTIIKEKWSTIDTYLLESEFSVLIGVLKDCVPVVAGEGYLVVSAKYDSLVNRFNSLYDKIEVFLSKTLGNKYYVVAISDDSWNIEKTKYIENLKNGIKYELKKIEEAVVNEVKKDENILQNDLDVLKDLVGDDIIKYV